MKNKWTYMSEVKKRLPVGSKAEIVYDPSFPPYYNTTLEYFRAKVGQIVEVLFHYHYNGIVRDLILIKVLLDGVEMHFYEEELKPITQT